MKNNNPGAEELLQSLINRGFDRSEIRDETGGINVRCSQCDALVIQGLACHETGCRNSKKDIVEDEIMDEIEVFD